MRKYLLLNPLLIVLMLLFVACDEKSGNSNQNGPGAAEMSGDSPEQSQTSPSMINQDFPPHYLLSENASPEAPFRYNIALDEQGKPAQVFLLEGQESVGNIELIWGEGGKLLYMKEVREFEGEQTSLQEYSFSWEGNTGTAEDLILKMDDQGNLVHLEKTTDDYPRVLIRNTFNAKGQLSSSIRMFADGLEVPVFYYQYEVLGDAELWTERSVVKMNMEYEDEELHGNWETMKPKVMEFPADFAEKSQGSTQERTIE